MAAAALLGLLLAPLAAHAGWLPWLEDAPWLDKRPSYPASFEVEYTFSLPYEATVQAGGVRYPVRFWRDEAGRRTRTDTYNSTNVLVQTQGATYEVVPRIRALTCFGSESDGPDAASLSAPILPDLRGWTYQGSSKLNGADVEVWELDQRHAHGAKVTHYTFYAAPDGTPVRLHQLGKDLFSGSHFDEYQADYTAYRPGRPAAHVFDVPAPCQGAALAPRGSPRGGVARAAMMLPAAPGSALYEALLGLGGGAPARPPPVSSLGPRDRAAVLQQNHARVEAWNAQPGRSFSLKLNHLAAWTQEEIRAALLPRKGRRRASLRATAGAGKRKTGELPYKRRYPKGRIPSAVDWRGTGAVGIVKDQATCGSCWAFGATGTLQGAYYLATGKVARFSEQQLMDCSWEHGNDACDGGEYDAALDYLVGVGGVALEGDYEYLGQDGFCAAVEGNGTGAGSAGPALTPLKGYAYVPEYDDEALMEAVYARGPIAVSMDASHASFSFYASGVYDEPACSWLPEDMDHAVTLIGYGTEGGKDYWLIKNSWSSHWGDEGVIKVARVRNGCGITSSPMYAIFEDEGQAASAQAA